MEILLAGSDNYLMQSLINKLNKEGHRCYVLTGSKAHVGAYKNAYERYRFSYDSDSLKEIFESVTPDVTIFLGAYDSNFDWSDARKESVHYLTAVQNILTYHTAASKGRFIYLSSEEVYSQSYPNDIPEEEPVSTMSMRSIAIAQGEEVCRNYKKSLGADTVILRLDHLYAMPEKRKAEDGSVVAEGICTKMCVEAISRGGIQANANKIFSLLYVDDAVEAIYKVIDKNLLLQDMYHVSSGEVTNELRLAELIKETLGEDIAIIDNTVGNPLRVVLSNQAFAAEFGLTIFHNIEEITEKTAKYVEKHSADYIDAEAASTQMPKNFKQRFRTIVRACIPFLENLICFIPFFMLNNRAVGSEYFANLDFYLIYVLLFALIYGQQQATFSAVLSVAGYCFRQMYNRTGLEVALDYNTYVWIAQLFILGLAVGYMRDQLRQIRGEGKTEVEHVEQRLDDIEEINTSNTRIKNMLEVQIVNQNDSIGKVYEITSSLDQYEPAEVLFYAAEVLARLIGSRDVAIYSVANRSYARLFSATSQTARQLGNSIEYTQMGEMYDVIKEKKVYINRSMTETYPLMADAIFGEDEMQIILMVWGIPWERMTLNQANMLTVIGYLIQNAVLRANRYIAALESQRYMEGTKILETDAFVSLVRAYLRAKNKGLTECTVLRIEMEGKDLETAGEELSKQMRQSDYLGKMADGQLYALLSNTNQKDSDFVIRRFKDIGYQSYIREEFDL